MAYPKRLERRESYINDAIRKSQVLGHQPQYSLKFIVGTSTTATCSAQCRGSIFLETVVAVAIGAAPKISALTCDPCSQVVLQPPVSSNIKGQCRICTLNCWDVSRKRRQEFLTNADCLCHVPASPIRLANSLLKNAPREV